MKPPSKARCNVVSCSVALPISACRGRRHTKQARPSTVTAGSKTPRVGATRRTVATTPGCLLKARSAARPSSSSSSPSSIGAEEHLRVEEAIAARAVTGSILLGLLDHLWIPASDDQTPNQFRRQVDGVVLQDQRTEPLLEGLRLVDLLAQLVQRKAEDDATADQRVFGVDDKVIAV